MFNARREEAKTASRRIAPFFGNSRISVPIFPSAGTGFLTGKSQIGLFADAKTASDAFAKPGDGVLFTISRQYGKPGST